MSTKGFVFQLFISFVQSRETLIEWTNEPVGWLATLDNEADAQFVSSYYCPGTGSSSCYRLSNSNELSTSVDTTGYTDIEVSYDICTTDLDSDEYCSFWYSTTSIVAWEGDWTQLGEHDTKNATESISLSFPSDVDNMTSVGIDFWANMDSGEYCFLNNFAVSGIPIFTKHPTKNPSDEVTNHPTVNPTEISTLIPSSLPTSAPLTMNPSQISTLPASSLPTLHPSKYSNIPAYDSTVVSSSNPTNDPFAMLPSYSSTVSVSTKENNDKNNVIEKELQIVDVVIGVLCVLTVASVVIVLYLKRLLKKRKQPSLENMNQMEVEQNSPNNDNNEQEERDEEINPDIAAKAQEDKIQQRKRTISSSSSSNSDLYDNNLKEQPTAGETTGKEIECDLIETAGEGLEGCNKDQVESEQVQKKDMDHDTNADITMVSNTANDVINAKMLMKGSAIKTKSEK